MERKHQGLIGNYKKKSFCLHVMFVTVYSKTKWSYEHVEQKFIWRQFLSSVFTDGTCSTRRI